MPVDVEAAGIDIHLAARSGDVKVVQSLVQRPGTDVEARDVLGDTALLKAARYGHTEVQDFDGRFCRKNADRVHTMNGTLYSWPSPARGIQRLSMMGMRYKVGRAM